MRAACFAAERGHQVTLFEKADRLGGKPAWYSRLYPDKWPIARYLDWLIGELGRRGVTDVRLNCAPEPEDLTKEGFDAVIACTGSYEICPPIEGADGEGIWKSEDVYMGRVEPGQKVVFAGGGDVAADTAMYLASTGRDVTVLTRQKLLMNKQANAHGPHMTYQMHVPELGYGYFSTGYAKYENLDPIYEVTTTKVTPHSVTYVQKDGEVKTLEADTVIVAGGYKPYVEEALKYAGCTPEFYLAGDANSDNCLMLGNRSAYGRALLL